MMSVTLYSGYAKKIEKNLMQQECLFSINATAIFSHISD